jgi:hypothetical protein
MIAERLKLVTIGTLLALFALAVDVQSYLPSSLSAVSLDLLFHENWRSMLVKDPRLRRSIMMVLSNRYGGTQDTKIDSHP